MSSDIMFMTLELVPLYPLSAGNQLLGEYADLT